MQDNGEFTGFVPMGLAVMGVMVCVAHAVLSSGGSLSGPISSRMKCAVSAPALGQRSEVAV